ncbi:Rv0909 family putative TA system antitoxin [Amnibacterium setariae]|uniref:Antitoxin n=1 Tax=Amnibacterium setariae TaxID=2306585 RepID=A0A3A1TV90_9MICO|nr:Rv0909 family putative TA system antitoxin [Amnibacterium setariae]RIX28173.1 antitoxin [Amnibacterium setariae]
MAGLFDQAKKFLNSEQGEKVSDQVLDAAAGAADKATGGKHTDKIRKARDAADDRVGTQDADRPRTTDPTASRDRF